MDYSNGKIYRIVCNITGRQYIGSTTQSLPKRLHEHKRKYKLFLEGKVQFITSFSVLENNNVDIILVESCPCKSKEELHRRERLFIETMDCVNKIIPLRTDAEYKRDNKEMIKEYDSTKIKCGCGKTIQRNSLSRHRRFNKHHLKYLETKKDERT